MGSYPSVERMGKFFALIACANIGDLEDKEQEFREVEAFESEAPLALDELFAPVERAVETVAHVLYPFDADEGVVETVRVTLPLSRQSTWVYEVYVRVRVRTPGAAAKVQSAVVTALSS